MTMMPGINYLSPHISREKRNFTSFQSKKKSSTKMKNIFLLLILYIFFLLGYSRLYAQEAPPWDGDCGKSSSSDAPVALISGGTAVPSIGKWPWLAKLVIEHQDDEGHPRVSECTGSIISDWHILTAAHCVDGFHVSEMRVWVGSVDWDKGNQFKVNQKHVNTNFDKRTLHSDIAVLKLSSRLQFDESVQPICVNNRFDERQFVYRQVDQVEQRNTASIAGWGFTEATDIQGADEDIGLASKVLYEGEVKFQDTQQCSSIDVRLLQDNTRGMSHKIVSDQIKKLLAKYRKAICVKGDQANIEKGDSGGPLMIYGDYRGAPRWVQIGICSSNLPRASADAPKNPSVFTSVGKFCGFIAGVIGRKCE